jgi:hypothetical protein
MLNREKFLLQADFLLTASREDINGSSRWNRALRDAFVDAVYKATNKFNSGPLRYIWPRYLPAQPVVSDFFSPLKRSILEKLGKESILESWNGQIVSPNKLVYVPEQFRDNTDTPLALTTDKSLAYLSQKYSYGDYKKLRLLGVVEMGFDRFLNDLKALLVHHFDDFAQKPSEWHSCLAKVLNQAPTMFKSTISKLPIIHLRSGEWVSGEEKIIFFPGESRSWRVPGGIDLLVVHSEVVEEEDHARRHLFQNLGVKLFDITHITQLIERHHSDPKFKPGTTSRQDLISQVDFLFTIGWRNPNSLPFWFATEHDERARGFQLYFDAKIAHSASKFFATNRRRFHFVHPDYLSLHASDQEGWLKWLGKNMGLSDVPKLVRILSQTSRTVYTFEMSPDFDFVIKSWASVDVLLLLCDHWMIYKTWLDPDFESHCEAGFEASSRRLKDKLSSTVVKCQGGTSCRLDETFLPIQYHLSESNGLVPFLDVPEPEHIRWKALKHLGVGVRRDVKFYLRCLDKLSGTNSQQHQVAFFLEQIQARYNDNKELVW